MPVGNWFAYDSLSLFMIAQFCPWTTYVAEDDFELLILLTASLLSIAIIGMCQHTKFMLF